MVPEKKVKSTVAGDGVESRKQSGPPDGGRGVCSSSDHRDPRLSS